MNEFERKDFIRQILIAGSSHTVVGIEDQVDKISDGWERDIGLKEARYRLTRRNDGKWHEVEQTNWEA